MVDTVGMANSAPTATTVQYSGRQARQLNGVAMAGATSARPLGVLSGVRPGTPANTVTATSTTWTCQPHAGIADVMVAAESGGYPFAFDAVATGAMTAADASNPRVDIIYDLITDPENGSTTPTASRGYLAGVAAASPVANAAPAGAFTIAQINVPKVGGGSPTVTWVAPYCAAAGASVDFNTKPQLDLWTTARLGQRAFVIANAAEYVWIGSTWVPTVPWVVPTSVTAVGGSAVVSTDGTVTFTSCSSVSLNGLFDGLGAQQYEIVLYASSPTSQLVRTRLRKAGADLTSGYSTVAVSTSLASGPSRVASSASDAFGYWCPQAGTGNSVFNGRMTLAKPGGATSMVLQSYAITNADRYLWSEGGSCSLVGADGLTVVTSSGVITGTINVEKKA